MIKVITYGTFDLFHYGHLRLLQRAKALGDYLIVGVTGDDFDKSRGKINNQQSLIERMEAVRRTGLADEIIVEEYEGQKIDDIRNRQIDIFTVGSDWVGKFDYLNEYCKVVYLERTQGVSSSELREKKRELRLGIIGDAKYLEKIQGECRVVNGVYISGICVISQGTDICQDKDIHLVESFEDLLPISDAVFIQSHAREHYSQVKQALLAGKHVLCISPVALSAAQGKELFQLAKDKGLILMEAIKTAYALAYSRMILLLKGGIIGEVVSVDVTCTSLKDPIRDGITGELYMPSSLCEWGPTAMLPIFDILGTNYRKKNAYSKMAGKNSTVDTYTKVDFLYDQAIASLRVGNGVKSEGELIVSGTKGYLYIPAPWWKTDYFEIRYENPANNKRYFYQLDGEGIRYELVAFVRSVDNEKAVSQISAETTMGIIKVLEDFIDGKDRETFFS